MIKRLLIIGKNVERFGPRIQMSVALVERDLDMNLRASAGIDHRSRVYTPRSLGDFQAFVILLRLLSVSDS